MTDVLLYHSADGGEINFVNGVLQLDTGLETSVYLSLFGGNELDSGIVADDKKQWWGNVSETKKSRKYRSETQHLLRNLPATPANLRRLEDAANRDLSWYVEEKIADKVTVAVSMPALNQTKHVVKIQIGNNTFTFAFLSAWDPIA